MPAFYVFKCLTGVVAPKIFNVSWHRVYLDSKDGLPVCCGIKHPVSKNLNQKDRIFLNKTRHPSVQHLEGPGHLIQAPLGQAVLPHPLGMLSQRMRLRRRKGRSFHAVVRPSLHPKWGQQLGKWTHRFIWTDSEWYDLFISFLSVWPGNPVWDGHIQP